MRAKEKQNLEKSEPSLDLLGNVVSADVLVV